MDKLNPNKVQKNVKTGKKFKTDRDEKESKTSQAVAEKPQIPYN